MSLFPMLVSVCMIPFYQKSRYKGCWLICEEPSEARDNGYHFFKYIRQNHPDQNVFYAISDGFDFHKVEVLGSVVKHGSVWHWLCYFLCEYNISSQKGGKPNAAVCSLFELNGLFRTKNVFLQHGITINRVDSFLASHSKIDCFITATQPEYDFVVREFGYPRDVIRLTGFSRFDALHDIQTIPNRILIMPTWRQWFVRNYAEKPANDTSIMDSEYVKVWRSFLQHPILQQMRTQYGLDIMFFPHRLMQPYLHGFCDGIEGVTFASQQNFDTQELLKSAVLMITDYSSVFFDMVYMQKPVIFFQFDEQKFRQYQHKKGYFDYHNTPFASWNDTPEGVLSDLKENILNKYQVSDAYLAEHERIFKFYDTNNSKRIYDTLIQMRDEHS